MPARTAPYPSFTFSRGWALIALIRSVRWQLVAKSGVNTGQALELLNGRELLPADVLVTALGTNDVTSQRKPYQFISDYEALVDALLKRVGARFAVISGLPPLHLTPATPQPLRWLSRGTQIPDRNRCTQEG